MTDTNARWSLSGDYVEACSCDAGCPCKFGAAPTQGHCLGILGFEINEGSFGGVDLSGVRFVAIIKAPQTPFAGNITATSYIDERAGDEQRRALETIISGEAGGFWAVVMGSLVTDFRGIKYAPIEMETSGNRRTLTIPGVVEIANEPLVNPMTEEAQEIILSNSFDPFCEAGRAGRSTIAVSSDPDLSFDVTGQQGYTGSFAWAGP